MINIKETNQGQHIITRKHVLAVWILLVVGIFLIGFSLVYALFSYFMEFTSKFLVGIDIASVNFVVGVGALAVGIVLLVIKQQLIIDTYQKMFIYGKQKIPFDVVNHVEYSRIWPVERFRVGYYYLPLINLSLVRTDNTKAYLFSPRGREITRRWIRTVELGNEDKEKIYDYILAHTPIKGKKDIVNEPKQLVF